MSDLNPNTISRDYIRRRHTYEENVIDLLQFCRIAKTKHAIKDKFSFCNEKLKKVMVELQGKGYLSVSLIPRDGRGTQSIQLTDAGKVYLAEKGIKY